MEIDYTPYSDYVGSICDSKNLTGFKSNKHYSMILEHVTQNQGQQYLECIFSLTNISKEDVLKFCGLNDSIGNPNKYKYDILHVPVSATSLRYIFHAHLILSHMKNSNHITANVIEVGGGYGGLCLALHHFSSKYGIIINSYKICDLPNIIRLQKLYLSIVNPALPIEFVDGTTYGERVDSEKSFLISNYCFSEISKEHQELYIQKLFPKVSNGFMAWNIIPVYDFGFKTYVEPEYPNTGGPNNKYVYF